MKTKSLIAALLLAASSAFAQVPSYVPTNGLVGWWPFNGNANDESGNGNNGTVNGATLTSDRFGSINSAYSFNGINNNVTTNSNNVNFNTNQDFSISLWVKISNTCSNTNYCGGFISKEGMQTNDNGIGFQMGYDYTNKTKFEYNTNLTVQPPIHFYTSTQLTPSIWTNIICVVEKNINEIRIYYNGNLEGTFNNSWIYKSSSNSNPLFFGMLRGSNYFLNGNLDDIGIWNRALNQQEITNLFNAQSCTSTTIIADGPTTFCAGNYVNLTSDVVGGSYQWKKNGVNVTSNGTSRTYKATATGSYTCVATCNGTALTSNAISVTSKTNAFASVTASGATSFCAGDSVTLNCTNLGSNYSVQWYRTNISMENAINYSQVVKQPGTYKVVTRNLTNGCSRISGSSVVVAVNCRLANPDVIAADITESDFAARGVNDEPKGKIYIYPNPTSDNKFTVELMGLELNGDAMLEVYNAMGQILSSEKVNITNGTLNRTIQIDEQSKGQLCIVRLIIGSEVYDSKVILK